MSKTLDQFTDHHFNVEWFTALANDPKMKNRKGDLAEAMGTRRGAVSDILAGKRKITYVEGMKALAFFKDVIHFDKEAGGRRLTVPLRGYVGAGAAMVRFADADDPNEDVDAPEGATEETVAVEVRGESLGALFDRWLVFYDEIFNPPTSALVGRLCVCGLADGRILVKQLKRGQIEGHYNLISNTEPPIYDQIIEWAAVVKQMTPR